MSKERTLSVYNQLLDEEQKRKMMERYDDLQFATVVYNRDAKLPVIVDTEDGVSVGEINVSIDRMMDDLD